jgi:hypothetical protein
MSLQKFKKKLVKSTLDLKRLQMPALKKLMQLQDKVDSLEGGKELTKIQEKYKDLVDRKSPSHRS